MRKASFFLACTLLFVAGMATTIGLQANWTILFPFSEWGEGNWIVFPLFGFSRIVYIATVAVLVGMSLFLFFSVKEKKE